MRVSRSPFSVIQNILTLELLQTWGIVELGNIIRSWRIAYSDIKYVDNYSKISVLILPVGADDVRFFFFLVLSIIVSNWWYWSRRAWFYMDCIILWTRRSYYWNLVRKIERKYLIVVKLINSSRPVKDSKRRSRTFSGCTITSQLDSQWMLL